MATINVRMPDDKYERLKQLARRQGISIVKLFEELSTAALAEFDVETRFRVRAGRGSVVIAMGDHQPPAIVTGPGRSWAVPVHVFTRNGAEIRKLESLGFRAGLVPARPPLGGMESLTGLLLRALGGPAL